MKKPVNNEYCITFILSEPVLSKIPRNIIPKQIRQIDKRIKLLIEKYDLDKLINYWTSTGLDDIIFRESNNLSYNERLTKSEVEEGDGLSDVASDEEDEEESEESEESEEDEEEEEEED